MKKQVFFFATIIFFMVALVKSNAQQILPNFYRYYYIVRDVEKLYPWRNQTSGSRSLYGDSNGYTGIDTQKWIIMPTFPGSNEFVIASKHDGNLLIDDIFSIRMYDVDFGRINFYKLNPISGTPHYAIGKSSDSQKTLTMQYLNLFNSGTRNQIISRDYTGNNDQKFSLLVTENLTYPLTSYRYKNNIALAQPLKPTNLQGANLCIECNETFMAETIVPFIMVKNDLPRLQQAKEYPYYKLEYSRLWKLVGATTFPSGTTRSEELSQTIGMSDSKVTEVSNKLSISVSSTSELSFKVGDIGGKVAASIGTIFEKTTKSVVTHEENKSQTTKVTLSFTAVKTTLIAEYQLVERYKLYRTNGAKILEWDVNLSPQFNTRVSYVEGESGGRLDNGSSLVVQEQGYASKDSYKINLIQKNAQDDAYFVDRVYPNPSNSGLTISLNIPEAASVTACFYDLAGRKIREVREDMAPAISNSLLKIDEAKVPKGMYLLKVDIVSIANPARKYSYKQKVVLH